MLATISPEQRLLLSKFRQAGMSELTKLYFEYHLKVKCDDMIFVRTSIVMLARGKP